MPLLSHALLLPRVPAGLYRAEGMIKNVNTIEEYKNLDKAGFLQQAGRTVSLHLLKQVSDVTHRG